MVLGSFVWKKKSKFLELKSKSQKVKMKIILTCSGFCFLVFSDKKKTRTLRAERQHHQLNDTRDKWQPYKKKKKWNFQFNYTTWLIVYFAFVFIGKKMFIQEIFLILDKCYFHLNCKT